MSQENPLVPASQSSLVLSPKKNQVLENMVGDALSLARQQVGLVPRDNLPAAPTSVTIPWLGLELLPIPAGEFLMGSPEDEEDRCNDETQHLVKISRPYWLAKYPVTQGQWEVAMGKNPSHFKDAGKDAPVEDVSWEDAVEFCQKLNEREGKAGRLPEGYQYSLPTEAEWEYACRAGTTTVFAFGDSLSSHQANFNGEYPYGGVEKGPYLKTTTPVGKYAPNPWGLYDMHGNVWEWCHDWFGDYPTGSVTDPTGPSIGSYRVGRGGSWSYYARDCRSALRFRSLPGGRDSRLGFRLCLSPVKK